ncbi:MAG: hypothetical protein GFH27_549357n44 [Chloroflexi bacterium AL-W]|nr:hypothetical protein [Chloroflexi bacterium AL-N1]NOK70681.1 hypothetical protein [Chloroflexi bacterium AL-N10]NOK78500.1 hypothetical protein [Chloroflexi bacterium AL-N5]NOK85584.1 hypothetical protein [Chloroflexi bacterium AL-W]NOK92498.1 hypothetical protein [Chloroflexi bacterium AL-N15]
MTFIIMEVILALLVIVGSVTIVWGVQRFQLSVRVMTIVFAITAVSWMAFIISTISITMRSVVFSSI